MTMVGGRVVMKDGKVSDIDEKELYKKCAEIIARIS
jgi:hypothetical protein